jgi:DtxR family Mn-dependent transcriptional regulator
VITQATEDYLKAIFEIQGREGKVSTTTLATHLSVSPASVTGMMKKLAEMNLVAHEPYQGVALTEAGRKIALEVIRHHRLVELYLHQAMGVPWDQVHHEAEKWEHILSEELEDRMDALLGHPTIDPHGAPIPTREGRIPQTPQRPLTELESGQFAMISEVSDHDSEMLRYLGTRGLYPGVEVQVVAHEPFGGPITVRVESTDHQIGREVASHISVTGVRGVGVGSEQ